MLGTATDSSECSGGRASLSKRTPRTGAVEQDIAVMNNS